MDNADFIDDYFSGEPTGEQQRQFEHRIIHDIAFAEEVAFYISANDLIREKLKQEKKQRFREIYQEQKIVAPVIKRPVNRVARYLAAACIVAAVILLTWFVQGEKNSPSGIADQYIQQNFKTLGVTMGTSDSLQTGLHLYNSGNLPSALLQFEKIIQQDDSDYYATKYAGIVSVRLGYYDKALAYFTRLEKDTALNSNPGKFYKAITLMKRNKNGDEDNARKLLKEVKELALEGNEDAGSWLKKMER